MTRWLRDTCVGLGFCVCANTGATWANGDEFYRFNALDAGTLESQVIFAGSVKDAAGNRIEDAKVTLSLTVPTARGDKIVRFNAYTNVAGRYRSYDVKSVVMTLEEIDIVVDPAQVSLSVSKQGYELVRAFNRSKPERKTGIFEIDFTLAAASDSESDQ